MKKYKSYLHLQDNEIPKTSHHRRFKKLGTKNKENSAGNVYKNYVSFNDSEFPRTTEYRRRKTLLPVNYNDNEGTTENDSVHYSQCARPAKRYKMEDQVQEIVEWSVNDVTNNDGRGQPPQTNSCQSLVSPHQEPNIHSQTIQDRQDIVCGGHHDHTNDLFPEIPHLKKGPNSNPSQGSEEDELLYPGAPISRGQSLLLLMSFILRHNLTGTALEDLLKLFNEHFPGSVPATSYLFHKAYGQYGQYESHFYCFGCTNYIGKVNGQTQCSICHMMFDADTNLKNGAYFLVLNLSSQIKDILENPKNTLDRKRSTNGIISDIHSGMEYEKLIRSGKISEEDVCLLWNCDGIPVFKSSNCQLWPIQCQIIELDPKERNNNICIPCIWFGDKKPNMTTLLTPFVDELQELEQNGIQWTDTQNQQHLSKVHALVCSSDSVARPQIRNTKQFNGTYGCDFCYHKAGGSYAYINPEPSLRCESEHFQHAMAATPQ
ncbi:uncharacterized protein LOC131536150 isoform X2 [Onychostoma macrolepis]|uniref:uncharacterized protein LOC131536150 isoform X2 n=1 Tax=Onychostoma macrolepis TaxID=369639 RepID=UPI00272CCEF3|nr:uncharacterized protein LOC131536150 isoform X2 [Onychostoma macrolepis]